MRELDAKQNVSYKERDKTRTRTVSSERCCGSRKGSVCILGEWFLEEAKVRGMYIVRDTFKALKVHSLCTMGYPFQVGSSLEVNLP